MPEKTSNFLTTLASNFMQDRLDYVADHFAFPLPLYANDNLQVFGASCTLMEILSIYRETLRKTDVVELHPRVLAEGLPVNGYSNVWVEWDHLDGEGTCLSTSQVHYVFYQTEAALFPRIELVEYTRLCFPEIPHRMSMAMIA